MIKKQLYFEDVKEGMEVTPLKKIATTRMLVEFAGASLDFNPLHYEDDFAKSNDVGSPIVHGALKRAWLGQLMTDWMGDEGTLEKFSCQYRGMDWPRKMKTFTESKDGETWWCKGKVTRKYSQDGKNLVECQIWVENGKGEITTPGTAVVSLPSANK